MPRVQELRARTGRPHWLVVDEAHHLLPTATDSAEPAVAEGGRSLYITVHPDQVAPAVLAKIDTLIAVGPGPAETIGRFCAAVHEAPPYLPPFEPEPGEVVYWSRRLRQTPRRVRIIPAHAERRRHTRKYAEGELPPERSFYFRGPASKLNLRAQNLMLFLQIADGVDDETWLHHLRAGDYSKWFRERIKDERMAADAVRIEQDRSLSAAESRKKIRSVVEQYYTQTANPPTQRDTPASPVA